MPKSASSDTPCVSCFGTKAVDQNDTIVSASSTRKLALACKKYIILEHHEGTNLPNLLTPLFAEIYVGHSIPVGGDFPQVMRDFILNAVRMASEPPPDH
jgi:hypothetical protein